MKKYEQLKKVIIEAVPEIKEIILPDYPNGRNREIHLADVLVAIQATKKDLGILGIDRNGCFIDCDKDLNNVKFHRGYEWNLHKNSLDEQSDPCKQFLIDLLVK
jgi:hypothetical protein